MSIWRVFEFLDGRNRGIVSAWLEHERVPKDQLAAFRAKIDALSSGGPEMVPGLIAGPIKQRKLGITGIYKMKIKGNKGWVQLRPMLCFGPLARDSNVITMLVGAVEKDQKLIPYDCLKRADGNRRILLNDPARRRILRIPR